MNTAVKDFTELIVWKKGHVLCVDLYKVTKVFRGTKSSA